MQNPAKTPEILSPAGNYEKMKAAVHFGADAVYLAGKRFGMRGAADNFTNEELVSAAEYLRSRGKKTYVTVNVIPRSDEFADVSAFLGFLSRDVKPDAVIAAVLGVMNIASELGLPVHVSTQAGVASSETAKAFYRLGAKRVVLARELSLREIRRLREETPPDLEIEAFVHGAMCVSFSGRCLLSNYLADRDANRGECAQPCRWEYHLIESKRPGMEIPIEQTDLGTFVMGSKDMNMIGHVPELIAAGIDSFKIEGRMKSAYYAAVTAAAYSDARDRAEAGEPFDARWSDELMNVTHREYGTGFYFGSPADDPNTCERNGYIRERTYFASADGYEGGRAYFTQKNKLSLGDRAEIFAPKKPPYAFTVTDMRDADGQPIESAPHPFQRFSLPIPFPVSEGDILRQG
ncbi:MAG: U32 family peptidase [Clostridia bacterium]|nr:U32 family peptidase [Clostridia bacterium]